MPPIWGVKEQYAVLRRVNVLALVAASALIPFERTVASA
jgi:hypothetical protein